MASDKGVMCTMFYNQFKGKNTLQLSYSRAMLVVHAGNLRYGKVDDAFKGPPAGDDAGDSDGIP
eukprot:gene18947-22640_t